MNAAEDKTAPFELGAGDDACLLLHGFTGTPWDVRPIGEALALAGCHVRAPRLPGHGLSPEAMLDVTWRDWERAAEDSLAALGPRARVFVAGLSMGALLALILAGKHPERIRGLALIAPAVHFLGPAMKLLRATRAVPWLEWVMPWVSKRKTDIDDPDVAAQAPIIPRFPSARLRDLWTLQDHARAALPRVKAPTLIAVARHDHVVDPDAGLALATQLPAAASVRTLQLERGFHVIPRDRDGPVLAKEVGAFVAGLRV
jgi:carboxylesterase